MCTKETLDTHLQTMTSHQMFPIKLDKYSTHDEESVRLSQNVQEQRKSILADAFKHLQPYGRLNVDVTRLPVVLGQYIAYLAVGSCFDSVALIVRDIKQWIPFVVSPRENLVPINVLLYDIHVLNQAPSTGILCAILNRRRNLKHQPFSVFAKAEDDFVDFTEEFNQVWVDGKHRFPWLQCRDQLFPLYANECVARIVASSSAGGVSQVQWVISRDDIRKLAAAITPLTVANHEYELYLNPSMLGCAKLNASALYNTSWCEKRQKYPLRDIYMHIGAAIIFSGLTLGLASKCIHLIPWNAAIHKQTWMSSHLSYRNSPAYTFVASIGIAINLVPLLAVQRRKTRRYWNSQLFSPAWHARPNQQHCQKRAWKSEMIALMHSLCASACLGAWAARLCC
jgi:hypothetical protein